MGRFDDREQKLDDARVNSNLLFDALNFKVFNFNGSSKRNQIALLIYRLSEECFMFTNLYLDEQIQVLAEISNMINFEIRNTDQIKSAVEYFTIKVIRRNNS